MEKRARLAGAGVVLAFAVAAALVLGLAASAATARAKQPAYTLELVYASAGKASFVVAQSSPRSRVTWWLVQLVVRCDGTLRVGTSAWVPTSGDEIGLSGQYDVGADCEAWVYRTARGDLLVPESNVVTFTG